ncbi:hypothetical protein [Lentzea sp. NPDC055074]
MVGEAQRCLGDENRHAGLFVALMGMRALGGTSGCSSRHDLYEHHEVDRAVGIVESAPTTSGSSGGRKDRSAWTVRVRVVSNGSPAAQYLSGGLTMVDMRMLSVAAALIGSAEESGSAALTQLEKAVRAVPGLGDALDAARAGEESDKIHLAEELANGLKAAYDGGGAFSVLLDALRPEVLSGPQPKWVRNVNTGSVHGSLIQLGVVGSIDLAGPSSPARSRFSFFGSGRRAKKHRP